MTEHRFITLDTLLEEKKYPFSKGQIRGFLLNREKNGLDKATRKLGKRIYFRSDLFEEWVNSHWEKMDENGNS